MLDMEGTFVFNEVFLDDYDSAIFFCRCRRELFWLYNMGITTQHSVSKSQNSNQADRVVVQEEAVHPNPSVAVVW